jgi:hypothetical protein
VALSTLSRSGITSQYSGSISLTTRRIAASQYRRFSGSSAAIHCITACCRSNRSRFSSLENLFRISGDTSPGRKSFHSSPAALSTSA